MAQKDLAAIESLKTLQSQLKTSLRKSPTALTPRTEPTGGDIATQLRLLRAKREQETLEQARLKERLYGPQTEEQIPVGEERSEGPISRGLAALSTPLYATVGAVEAILGKGTKKGLANIPANIKERQLMGDLLRKSGAPGIVAMPLGLALDIALDPVNWATVGTAAFLPRVASGLGKGGVKGAILGAKSSLLSKAETLGRFVPGATRGALAESPTGVGAAYKRLTDAARSARQAWRTQYGLPLSEELSKRAATMEAFGETVKKYTPQQGIIGKFVSSFVPKNKNWFAEQRKIDEAVPLLSPSRALEVSKLEQEGLAGTSRIVKDLTLQNETGTKLIDEGAAVALYDGKRARVRDFGGVNNLEGVEQRLTGAAADEIDYQNYVRDLTAKLEQGVKEVAKTEVDWYDNLMANIDAKHPIVKKFLDGYGAFIQIFKSSKVGLRPAAYPIGVIGNLTMPAMAGLDIWQPNFIGAVKNAFGILSGRGGKAVMGQIEKMITDTGWRNFMEKYPGIVRKSFGFDPRIFTDLSGVMSEHLARLGEAGRKLSAQEIETAQREISRLVKNVLRSRSAEVNPVTMARGLTEQELAPTFLSAEIYQRSFNELIDRLSKSSSILARGLAKTLTGSMRAYEYIDQSFKFGTAMHLSQFGLGDQELKLLSRLVRIYPDDVIEQGGRYLIKPLKATELSHEIYMNYAAMPAAVKVLRSLPFFGAPFASFMYGMAVKSGKTLMYNPALYNKIQSLFTEAQGQKTPLEKVALKQPYYQWYNRPGMIKLVPFFGDNPVYLNVANMVPYYTMNIFQPSERQYSSRASGIAAAFYDKLPIFKTPEAQIIFDYFIQPLVLKESFPRGMFDQPLWPRDATGWEKTRNVIRSAVESVTPDFIGLAGLFTPEDVADYLPSFRWRQLARAKAGKTSEGLETTEPATQKTLRALSSTFGFPLQELSLRNIIKRMEQE